MVCVYCGGEMKVTNSRLQKRNNQVWRRRQCLVCGAVFTTHEVLELESALKVDWNGHFIGFQRDILLNELHHALQDKKDVYIASQELLSTIVRELLQQPQKPVFKKTDISSVTASVLKRFDRQAYLRYVADHPSLQ
jgi:transcriptional repressor NrdR